MKLPRIPKLFVGPYRELRRPVFDVNTKLVSDQLAAAEAHPVNGIKPVYIEEQPDYGELERLPIG
jgi:hypothetical protein